MKLAKSTLLVWLLVSAMAGFLLLTATGCKKAAAPKPIQSTLSPEQAKEQRLTWNLKTLVEAYEKAGHTNPKWDEPAKRALTEFARSRSQCVESNEAWGLIVSSNCIIAVNAGCDDPMIRYLYVRFSMNQTNSAQAFTDAFCKTAHDMDNSSYPAIRKFYAAQRAVDQLFYTYGYNTNNLVLHPIFAEIEPLVGKNLLPALDDKSMPAEEAFEACDAALAAIKGQGIADYPAYTQAYHCIEKPMFNNWSDAYTTLLLKGEAYIQLAWAARGPGLANTVTEEGWKLFRERLAIAENALTNAWQVNPGDSRIADYMLEVELGQGEGRDRLELWFGRSMALNPNDYAACSSKLNYLTPKWYGSTEDMLQFGRECAANKQWGGNVPLVLLDAHYWINGGWTAKSEQTNYWKQPEVWSDLDSAYERFFAANPDATGRYYQYAWYAYKCGQWAKFIELIPKLGPVNYDYFGGKDKFDEMVQLAKEHAGSPKVEENK
jgi:hypothetical protein